MVSVPAPFILAPILFRKLARSTISGSCAAFSITVVPSASAAAIMITSVAPTLGKSRYIVLPVIFSALASTMPRLSCSSFILTPRALSPFRWSSTGLFPIAQPPGRCITALPVLSSRAPSTRIDARIIFTRSNGASYDICPLASISTVF